MRAERCKVLALARAHDLRLFASQLCQAIQDGIAQAELEGVSAEDSLTALKAQLKRGLLVPPSQSPTIPSEPDCPELPLTYGEAEA